MATVELVSGQTIPAVGLGTLRSEAGVVAEAVVSAISQGCRLIDCAEVYGNEAEVGTGLQAAIADGTVSRDELTVVSKVFCNHHHVAGEDRVRQAAEGSVAALGVGAVDLYLMHWPFAFADEQLPAEGLRLPNSHPQPEIKITVEFLDTYREMAKLQEAGLVKAIGVSNFTIEQLEELAAAGLPTPAVNQVEFHPFLYQKELLAYCDSNSIQLMAYSPLGAGAPVGGSSLLDHPTILELAATHSRSPAQVLVRWSVQLGVVCIPKSTDPTRIGQNLDAFSWELSAADMEKVASLDLGHRFTRGFVEGQWFDEGELTGAKL